VANPNDVRVIRKKEFVLEALFSFPVHPPWLGEGWGQEKKKVLLLQES